MKVTNKSFLTRFITNKSFKGLHRKFYNTYPSQINWTPKSKSKVIDLDTVREGLSEDEIRIIKTQSKVFR